jgi:hypothetical protein
MFVRWTGNGIFAPIIVGIGVFGVTNITKSLYGPSYVPSCRGWVWRWADSSAGGLGTR